MFWDKDGTPNKIDRQMMQDFYDEGEGISFFKEHARIQEELSGMHDLPNGTRDTIRAILSEKWESYFYAWAVGYPARRAEADRIATEREAARIARLELKATQLIADAEKLTVPELVFPVYDREVK